MSERQRFVLQIVVAILLLVALPIVLFVSANRVAPSAPARLGAIAESASSPPITRSSHPTCTGFCRRLLATKQTQTPMYEPCAKACGQ